MTRLSDLQAFTPVKVGTVPTYVKRSAVAISPRFPRDGVMAATPASGTTGSAGTIIPERSAVEAQAWGATLALWSYTDTAVAQGYASQAAFIAEFAAAGIPIGGSTNTRAASPSTGPFQQDLSGSNWSAGSNPLRPILISGTPQNPLYQRIATTIDYMPAGDSTVTWPAKSAIVAAQVADGTSAVHLDDPRGPTAYAGALGILSGWDITSQGCDFSATAISGFTTWLGANTTSGQRAALGLPASLTGFSIKTWLTTTYPAFCYGAGQVDPAAVDNYLFRTSISSSTTLRTVLLNWLNRYLQDDHATFVAAIKAASGVPLSFNFWNAAPSNYISWHAERGLFDYAIAETAPAYWEDYVGTTVGSAEWLAVRLKHAARNKLNASTCDLYGLRAFFEHKPTAPNAAPAGVLVRMLRQTLLQTVADGYMPVVPIDVFMTTNDEKSQGVNVDGYRFWGGRSDYKTVFDFIKRIAPVIDDYEHIGSVGVFVASDSFPFHSGGSAAAFARVIDRLAELMKRDIGYHLIPVCDASGSKDRKPSLAQEAGLLGFLRVQDDADYFTDAGRLQQSNSYPASDAAYRKLSGLAICTSSDPFVRCTVRRNAATGRVAIHLLNFATTAAGDVVSKSTTLRFSQIYGAVSAGTVYRIDGADEDASFVNNSITITVGEYAVIDCAVAER